MGIRKTALLVASTATVAASSLAVPPSLAGASGPGLRLVMSTSHINRGQPVGATLCNGKVARGFHVAIEKKPASGGSWRVVFAKAVPRGVATCTNRQLRQPTAGTFLFRGQLIRGASAKVTTGTHEVVVAIPPRVLWSASGSGSQSGPKFAVPAGARQWLEVWQYDCSSYGSRGNFIASITGYGSAQYTTDSGVNQLGNGGHGINHYFDTGTFSIQIISECDWTETIELPA